MNKEHNEKWEEIVSREKNIVKISVFTGIITISAALYVSTLMDPYWSLYFWGGLGIFMYSELILLRRKVFLMKVKEMFLKNIYKRDIKEIPEKDLELLDKLTGMEDYNKPKGEEKNVER